MALHVEVSAGDVIRIGGNTVLTVGRKSGSKVRLSIESEYRVSVAHGDEASPTKPKAPDPAASPSLKLQRPNPDID